MAKTSGTADLHIHTCYSDGRPTVRAVLDYVAQRTRLQVIAITDHDIIEGALEADALQGQYPFQVIVGEEVSSREGHILALFIRRRIPPRLSGAETIAAIHEQGGLAIAAHPFITAWSFGEQVEMQGVGKALARLSFDGVEVDNSTPLMRYANWRAQRFNRRYCRFSEIGNSDAHIVEAIGKSYTRFPGTTAADLRLALERGQTAARRVSYASRELVAYGRFWLESIRPQRRVVAGME
jgi:predicted metal-dependent phosphoesterase TrpH